MDSNFDPNGVGIKGTLFGLPYSSENSAIIIIPVPWEVTVSYGSGTAEAPMNILDGSTQVDLYDPRINEPWKMGISMLEIDPVIQEESYRLRQQALEYIRHLEMGDDDVEEEEDYSHLPSLIDEGCLKMINWVKEISSRYIQQGKIVGLLGGDHSTPLGFLQALKSKHESFSILQIDAHADLRDAYEGFKYSHASIMYNVIEQELTDRIVQVGVRDFGEDEHNYIKSRNNLKCFFDQELKEKMMEGTGWKPICKEIIDQLGDKVYVSFDIDGLDPKLCPGTGTPVPGGLEFSMIAVLLRELAVSGREVIGFDLVEVGAHPWDGNVGARILYELCKWTGVSNKKLSIST